MSELLEYIKLKQGDNLLTAKLKSGEVVLKIAPDKLRAVVTFLKEDSHCLFNQLMDICGVDYPDRTPRFEIVYQLLSLKNNRRVQIKVATDEEIYSLTDFYASAAWYERETFDMFGVKFKGNNDLRRILTDYDFEGFPLRKDFPLVGEYDLFYSEEQRKVIKDAVKLNQEYREFDFVPERNQSHE